MTDYDNDEIKKLILKLRDNDDLQPSQIGMTLRDNYGIPSVKDALGKSITNVLEEDGEGLRLPEDLRSLIISAMELREHLEENPKDTSAKKGLQEKEARIRSLGKYYAERETINPDWRYDPNNVNVFID